MGFGNPIWLWGFVGLLIPVIIHLLSRKEGRVLLVGSVRHLRESATAQFRSIRLNQILLLLLRSALIASIVLFLSSAFLKKSGDSKNQWLVIEKGLEKNDEVKTLIDSLNDSGFETHYLSNGFPLLNDSADTRPTKNYWGLAEDLAAKNLDSVLVISYNFEKYFKGKRIPMKVNWLHFSPSEKEAVVKAVSVEPDSVRIIMARFSEHHTSFEKTKKSKSAAEVVYQSENPDTIYVDMISEKEFEYDKKILLAAVNAIQTVTNDLIVISQHTPADFESTSGNWTIWLADQQFSGKPSSKFISVGACSNRNLRIIEEVENVQHFCNSLPAEGYVFTSRLSNEVALEKKLTENLATLFFGEDPILPDDRLTISETSIWSKEQKEPLSEQAKYNRGSTMEKLLLAFILFLFMSERWISYSKHS
jgi:hypothetical protein